MVLTLAQFLHPRGHLAVSGDVFHCQEWGERMLLAASREGPEMLLHIPESTAQPTAASQPAQMSAVPGLRNCRRQKANIITIKRGKP